MRIDVSYCVELNKVVDIHQACLEFAYQDYFKKFHFLCSDPICRISKSDGVRVTGVNHNKSPEDHNISKSPHFRVWDDHINSCEWVELNSALHNETLLKSFELTDVQRRLLRKLRRLITRFIIPDADGSVNDDIYGELEKIRKVNDNDSKRKRLIEYARGVGSTATSLESLVSCYEELKEEKALDEKFSVKGYGETTFRQAFTHILNGTKNGFSIYHGGAKFYKRYGSGFRLSFIDRIDGVPISFYVAQDDLKNYKPSARLKRIIDDLESNKDRNPYVKVYWIGGIERTDKGYNAIFNSLAHVVFRLVYPEQKNNL